MTWPHRTGGPARRLDFDQLSELEFHPLDHARFPAVSLAYRAIREGGTAGAVLNAANEMAVEAFLDRRIPYPDIVTLCRDAMDAIAAVRATDLDTIRKADADARAFVSTAVQRASAGDDKNRRAVARSSASVRPS
jgi:1-deoxy-D-xylulose-5-phosphate reductoisomerase